MRLAMTRRGRGSRGYVLLTVLWIGLALLLAVSAFLSGARQDALTVRAEVGAARAAELARSGLNVALADLGRISDEQITSPRDGTPVTITMAEGSVTYRIVDESGKIDILEAPSQLIAPALQRIAEAEGVDAFDAVNLADRLEGFAREENGNPRTVYRALREAGLSGQTALVASRALTTMNFTAQVNPATAPRIVLESVPGIGPSDVEDILQRRADGRPLPRLGTAAAWLVEREGPVYTIDAESVLITGARAHLQAQVAVQGLSFRGGMMRYEILSFRMIN